MIGTEHVRETRSMAGPNFWCSKHNQLITPVMVADGAGTPEAACEDCIYETLDETKEDLYAPEVKRGVDIKLHCYLCATEAEEQCAVCLGTVCTQHNIPKLGGIACTKCAEMLPDTEEYD